MEGFDFWLERSYTYQAREVQEPERKYEQTRKNGSGGMVEVGRRLKGGSLPKPIYGLKRSCREKINPNSKDGSGGMWWWVGRDGGTSLPKPMPGSERS